MPKYQLTCRCGADVMVDVRQAGEQIVCPSCGDRLEVPPLRKLRHLPVVASEQPTRRATWSARHGVVAAALVLAAILLAVAAANRLTEPDVPEFDPHARLQAVDEALETLTPAQGWQMWVELYRPLAERGFALIEDPHKPAIQQHIVRQRFFQKMLLAVAALAAAIALAAALWPRQTPRR